MTTEQEVSARIAELVDLSENDSTICGVKVPQRAYLNAQTARFNCPNYFNSGTTYTVYSVADNGNGEYVFSTINRNLDQAYNLCKNLLCVGILLVLCNWSEHAPP